MRGWRVCCGGEWHTVSISDAGDVVLEDHDERAEMAQIVLGGVDVAPPLCVQMLLFARILDEIVLHQGATCVQYDRDECLRGDVVGLHRGVKATPDLWSVAQQMAEGPPWRVPLSDRLERWVR